MNYTYLGKSNKGIEFGKTIGSKVQCMYLEVKLYLSDIEVHVANNLYCLAKGETPMHIWTENLPSKYFMKEF